jgi:hypothetical protein
MHGSRARTSSTRTRRIGNKYSYLDVSGRVRSQSPSDANTIKREYSWLVCLASRCFRFSVERRQRRKQVLIRVEVLKALNPKPYTRISMKLRRIPDCLRVRTRYTNVYGSAPNLSLDHTLAARARVVRRPDASWPLSLLLRLCFLGSVPSAAYKGWGLVGLGFRVQGSGFRV